MFTYTAGFLGAGNMGSALAAAACRRLSPSQVIVACKTEEHTRAASERLGCHGGTALTVAGQSRFLFLGVKPAMVAELSPVIAPALREETVIVSMLAGVSLERLLALFGSSARVIRIMPNTPCGIGAGMILYTSSAGVTEEDKRDFLSLMAGAGEADEVPERLIDAGGTLTGCGPAFAYLFL